MWTKYLAAQNSFWAIANRRYHWGRHYRDECGDITDICDVTSQGWVIYELFGQGLQNVVFRMAVMTDEGHVIDYPLSSDEFWANPAMPHGWAIPF